MNKKQKKVTHEPNTEVGAGLWFGFKNIGIGLVILGMLFGGAIVVVALGFLKICGG